MNHLGSSNWVGDSDMNTGASEKPAEADEEHDTFDDPGPVTNWHRMTPGVEIRPHQPLAFDEEGRLRPAEAGDRVVAIATDDPYGGEPGTVLYRPAEGVAGGETHESLRGTWERRGPGHMPWWEIAGRYCRITIERRPHYCDRGNYIAKIHAWGPLQRDLDSADRWPRYYMDLERAKAEVYDWLVKRGQL